MLPQWGGTKVAALLACARYHPAPEGLPANLTYPALMAVSVSWLRLPPGATNAASLTLAAFMTQILGESKYSSSEHRVWQLIPRKARTPNLHLSGSGVTRWAGQMRPLFGFPQ